MMIFARKKNVSGAIVRLRGESHLESRRHTDHYVAHAGFQCVAEETAPLCPPGVLNALTQILGQQLSEFVFKTLATLI
jgi:hypothetical protein